MPKRWTDVEQNPQYQSLSDDEKDIARRQYFNDVVAPQVPESQREGAFHQFLTDTTPLYTRQTPGRSLEVLPEVGAVGEPRRWTPPETPWYEREWQEKFRRDPIEAETLEANPWIDPTTAFITGFGSSAVLSKGAPLAARGISALSAGLLNAAADIPIGIVADEVAQANNAFAFPVALGLGILSGRYENMIRKGILKTANKVGMKGINKLGNLVRPTAQKVKKLTTVFDGLDENTKWTFIKYREGRQQMKRHAAAVAHRLTKDYSDEQLRALQLHMEQPMKYGRPEGMEELQAKINKLQKWSFFELNSRFLNDPKDITKLRNAVDNDLPIPSELKPKLRMQKWPNNEIDKLTDMKDKLSFKLNNTTATEAQRELTESISDISARIEQLSQIQYLKRVTRPSSGIRGQIAGRARIRTISRRPEGLLGRKFATVEEAEEAGKQVKGLPSALADLLYATNRTIEMDDLIKSINRNPDFSLQSGKAPADWVNVDERILPSGKYRKYHPAMADALKEVSYISSPGKLQKAYDKLNTLGKVIGFYNPIIMGRYNVSQGIRAAGVKWLRPNQIKEAWGIYKGKGETYEYLEQHGLFNKMFDTGPASADIAEQLRTQVGKVKGVSAAFKATVNEVLHPTKLAKDIWSVLHEGAWKIDEVQRITTWLHLKNNPKLNQYYDDRQIIELVNDFHANYGKVPAQLRTELNRLIFTPTYKISMARVLGRMHTEPKALWPQLLRSYAMKLMFNKYVPIALAGYYKYKGMGKRARVEGYRVIISDPEDPKKETVYSISDPILEDVKILNRPFYRTIKYNLASIPAAIFEFIKEPSRFSKNENWMQLVNSYFKLGAPVVRELALWQKEDKETFQKFMQNFGLAYVYQRSKKPELQENSIAAMGRAMGLWTDWKSITGEGKKK